MTATLADRYVAATIRTLPPGLQAEVRDELDASIADAVAARVAQGEPAADAERAVLTDLGDPDVLAAGYADRPLHLIGPKYYLMWWRLLKLLLAIVPACAAVGVAIAGMVADDPVGTIIGEVVVVIISTIVHVAFWTTVVFAVLERTGADTGMRWSVDSLPEPQESGASRSDLIGSLVVLGIFEAVLLWDRFIGLVLIGDSGVDVGVGLGAQTAVLSVLDPQLWPWWIGAALVIIGVEAAIAIAVFVRRGWTPVLAVVNTVTAVVFAAAALYLVVAGRLLNPAFVDATLGRDDVPDEVGRILAIILAVVIVGVATWDIIDSWLKVRRARGAGTSRIAG
ncbi:hypothetical protein IM711_04505 [Microbacterium esteraromaticum]|uniref:permease prefix domain 1-containing protein n=1 Tax=Microbacterium esteraromaticum TaxID=57043 RepID=UPI003C308188